MKRKLVDRRVAIITLGGLIATSSLAFLTSRFWPSPPPKSQSNPTQYQEPTWWDDKPPLERKYFLALDAVFWEIEAQSPPPAAAPPMAVPFNAAAGMLKALMSQSGNADTKKNLAVFIADSRRGTYIPYLIPSLDSSVSGRDVRLTTVSQLLVVFQALGPPPFSAEVNQALATSFSSEQDAFTKSRLNVLLNLLNVPH